MDEIEFSYEPENTQMLNYYINDYSEKLKLISNKIDKRKRNHHFSQLLTLALSVPTISYLLLFDTSLFTGLVLIALASIIMFNIFLNAHKLKSLRSDAREVALKLEKIVRAASQIHEHAIRNEVQRRELDLHLAKSELVLEHYYRAKASGKSLVL